VQCANILIKYGANINEPTGLDSFGLGGQTPIYHTVNQHDNKCMDMMKLLLTNGADLSVYVIGFIWGKGYDWETFIPDVSPVSYAMMGLLPQIHRSEFHIYQNVSILLKVKYNVEFTPQNIPNKYLKK
jgi:hypothetical protein